MTSSGGGGKVTAKDKALTLLWHGVEVADYLWDIEQREKNFPALPVCQSCPGNCKVHDAPSLKFYCHRKNFMEEKNETRQQNT
jgi:hypothetical protein